MSFGRIAYEKSPIWRTPSQTAVAQSLIGSRASSITSTSTQPQLNFTNPCGDLILPPSLYAGTGGRVPKPEADLRFQISNYKREAPFERCSSNLRSGI